MKLLSMICFSFYIASNYAETISWKFKTLQTSAAWGDLLVTINDTILYGCAGHCARHSNCEIAYYAEVSKTCTLWRRIVTNPVGDSNNTALIKGPISLFIVWGYFDYGGASAACAGYGANLASYSHVQAAFNAKWLHHGTCTFMNDGKSYYALQFEVSGLGYQGINECFWEPSAGAFCHLTGI